MHLEPGVGLAIVDIRENDVDVAEQVAGVALTVRLDDAGSRGRGSRSLSPVGSTEQQV